MVDGPEIVRTAQRTAEQVWDRVGRCPMTLGVEDMRTVLLYLGITLLSYFLVRNAAPGHYRSVGLAIVAQAMATPLPRAPSSRLLTSRLQHSGAEVEPEEDFKRSGRWLSETS